MGILATSISLIGTKLLKGRQFFTVGHYVQRKAAWLITGYLALGYDHIIVRNGGKKVVMGKAATVKGDCLYNASAIETSIIIVPQSIDLSR